MSWFDKIVPSRIKTQRRSRSVPEGLWEKCAVCDAVLYRPDLERNLHVCPKCSHHMRIGARERLRSFLDPESTVEIGAAISPEDPLKFKDSKRYKDRLAQAQKLTRESDALVALAGRLHGEEIVACAFEFNFLGGSMGSVVGERFKRSVDHCVEHRCGLVCFTATGGARMQEALLSLMQMTKTSAALVRLARAGLPFISVMTDPTMGGVSASLAMLGDLNLAEPRALIGFAGPRVIQQTVRETLPEGFQRSEFLLEHGGLDMIVDRRDMRERIAQILRMLQKTPRAAGGLRALADAARPRSFAEWLDYQQGVHGPTIDMSLERVRAVAAQLELLEPTCPTVIVAGTNGKGSTATMLAAMLQACGRRVGLFTSPHLQRYTERIQVNGTPVDEALLLTAFERIEQARGHTTLTFFEYNTLAALQVFRDSHVETQVLEVGLGGRLDATNIIDADVAVLCSVGLDHRDWLGDTLEQIGAEKAGIFRANCPVVLGSAQMPESVWRAVRELRCPAYTAGNDFQWQVGASGNSAASWDYQSALCRLTQLPAPALSGDIQYRNAAAALTALLLLQVPGACELERIGQALRQLRLPGRLQIERIGDVEWILDVAHNEPAAQVLAAALAARPHQGRTIAVTGILLDKDAAAITRSLDSEIDAWVLAGVSNEPRGQSAQELAARLPPLRSIPMQELDVPRACERARVLARPGDRIVVLGSFHVVGPALAWLGLY